MLGSDLPQLDEVIEKEWIIADGYGGFLLLPSDGKLKRKYHGAWICSLSPPFKRHVIVSGVQIRIYDKIIASPIDGEGILPIYCTVNIDSISFLYKYEENPLRVKYYFDKGINVVVDYRGSEEIEIFPLFAMRHIYEVNNEKSISEIEVNELGNSLSIKRKGRVFQLSSNGELRAQFDKIGPIRFRLDEERGEDHVDFQLSPCLIKIRSEKALISIKSDIYEVKKLQLQKPSYNLPNLDLLYRAADQLIVRGAYGKRSIIAGYPWFTVWTRDSFIAMPGLLIVRGRFKDARGVLLSILKYERDGVLPEFIDEINEKPIYTSVDSTLWLAHALKYYLAYTNDTDFLEKLFPKLKAIVDRHLTSINEYGLLEHGPWTWMDVKIDDNLLIDRSRMAVEVEALWISLLDLYVKTCKALSKSLNNDEVTNTLGRAERSFEDLFWCEEKGWFYDHIGEVKDSVMRPNQVIALAMDCLEISPEKAKLALTNIWKELATSFGLRSLSPREGGYIGRYRGDIRSRDLAYHNGTVWPWLSGFLSKVSVRYGLNSRVVFNSIILPLLLYLPKAPSPGCLNEIFDGDPPHRPDGCLLQAWSVGEVIRSSIEDYMGKRGEFTEIWLA